MEGALDLIVCFLLLFEHAGGVRDFGSRSMKELL